MAFNLVFSLLAPNSASTTKDPGVKIATATAADTFSRLLGSVAFSDTGYLIAPHDWHKGVSCCSVALQNGQVGIDFTLIKLFKILKYNAV